MIRATKVHASGSWTAQPKDTVVLEFDDRHRRRTVMSGVQGLAFLLDLPDAVMLRGGDALELEDGGLVEVVSAPEPLVEVRAKSAQDLVRLAWHIGNRHLPAQLAGNGIRIRQDHVIEDMLRGLGATLRPIEAPFDPEGGAYASAARHGHDDHGHNHHGDDDHGHGHARHDHDDHGHKHGAHAHPDDDHGHKHGAHDHGHDHGGHDHGGGKSGHKHHDH